MGVGCTVVCLEEVPDGVSNAPEVVQSIPEFPGFWEILRNEVWGRGYTPEGYHFRLPFVHTY